MIDQDQKDVLSELVNISFGSATAAIADLFDNFATLHVPEIEFIALEEINASIMGSYDDNKFYVTTQQFKGKFQGEVVFVIPPNSARNMQAILDDEVDIDEYETRQNILEISNILGSSCIGKLAELLSTDVVFAPPTIEYADQLIQDVHESPYNQVIIIRTVLTFEQLAIHGKLVIMIIDEMYVWLEQALNEFMENL